jgi:hypothetical protein
MRGSSGLFACVATAAVLATCRCATVGARTKPWTVRASARGARQRNSQGLEGPSTRNIWGVRGGSDGKGQAVVASVAGSSPRPSTKVLVVAGGGDAAAKQRQSDASNLTIAKLLMLLFYGSLGSVMPYLPVYYHSLGLPGAQPHASAWHSRLCFPPPMMRLLPPPPCSRPLFSSFLSMCRPSDRSAGRHHAGRDVPGGAAVGHAGGPHESAQGRAALHLRLLRPHTAPIHLRGTCSLFLVFHSDELVYQ